MCIRDRWRPALSSAPFKSTDGKSSTDNALRVGLLKSVSELAPIYPFCPYPVFLLSEGFLRASEANCGNFEPTISSAISASLTADNFRAADFRSAATRRDDDR